jgi:hypothetical protein
VAANSSFPSVPRPPGVSGLVSALWGTLTWRALLATQSVGVLYALTEWLTSGSAATPRLLAYLVCSQAVTACLVLLAALAGDGAVRRGWKVLRAFLIVVLGASLLNAAAQWLLDGGFGDIVPQRGPAVIANDFFNVGVLWGTVLLVYLNRQSAARLLARLRADELARLEAERRVIAARLAAAETRLDPQSMLRQLSEVRDQFAAGRASADSRLEELIAALRAGVSRSDAGNDAVPKRQEARF